MSKEQFARKYIDTHKGIHCGSDLMNGAYKNGSLIKMSPGDKNIYKERVKGQSLCEPKCSEERAEAFKHYLMDANAVRSDEILDPEKMPIKDLLSLIVRTLPQKTESKEMHFTFADMVKQAAMDKGKIVDVEPVATDED